ncbi:hypothetical protein HDV05_001241 [Chytridiales sp. JEL 0842]|nr:hypothetical protein HDV05_001241 [Chytridiales sp. JEL 0842]
MNYMGSRYRDKRAIRQTSPNYKKCIVTMKDDFNFPLPPTPEKDGAIVLPPPVMKRVASRFWRHNLPPPTEAQLKEAEELKAKQQQKS